MNPSRLVTSKRGEKAKRLNANEDNLLQMEMERFKKQHNKEMKNILLEKQMAKEAMSDIRRHRASSLLAARRVLPENNACTNNTISSPTLSPKLNPEIMANRLKHSSETQQDMLQIRQPCLPNSTQKSPNVERKFSEDVAMNLFPSGGPRKRAQTFSQGTTLAASDLESVSQSLPQRSPNLERKFTKDVVVKSLPFTGPRKRAQTFSQGLTVAASDLESVSQSLPQRTPNLERKFTEDVVVKSLPFTGSCKRAQTFSQATTVAASELESVSQSFPQRSPNLERKVTDVVVTSLPFTGPRNRAQTFSQGDTVARSDLESVSPTMKILEPITVAWKLKNQWDQLKDSVEGRPRSFSDESSNPSSQQNSPEPESVRSSPSLRVRSLSRSPLAVRRRVSVDDVGRLFIKRSSLEVPCMNSTLQRRTLSPSTGIAKFRQTGAAASAAQALVSRHQREKSISKATENLIAEREKREMIRQGQQQMKEDNRRDTSCYKSTTGLKKRFYTIAQLVMALNALKTVTRRRRLSFTEEKTK